MIDGQGDPNTAAEYSDAVAALYSIAYPLKFAVKRTTGRDYAVMPLEGLWWADDMTNFTTTDKSAWQWTMMIRQPDGISPTLVDEMMAAVARKKPQSALAHLSFERLNEGCAAQILHRGAYAAEQPTIACLHAFIAAQGYFRRGKHHEIYLNDPGRTASEQLRTIIRQPIERRERAGAALSSATN
jgi:hypothetical protein